MKIETGFAAGGGGDTANGGSFFTSADAYETVCGIGSGRILDGFNGNYNGCGDHQFMGLGCGLDYLSGTGLVGHAGDGVADAALGRGCGAALGRGNMPDGYVGDG